MLICESCESDNTFQSVLNDFSIMEKVENSETSSSSGSDSESDEVDEGPQGPSTREKRSVFWNNNCACEVAEVQERVVWPPRPGTASNYTAWRNLNHVRPGNPLFGTRMQLYSRTGTQLAVFPNGRVKGVDDDNDVYTLLELESAFFPGHVRIKGIVTNLYVAMNKRGRLYGEANPSEEGTVFIENFQGSYTTYLSRKYAHLGWYIGLKKSGRIKRGPKTAYGQKAISFLPRRSRFQ